MKFGASVPPWNAPGGRSVHSPKVGLANVNWSITRSELQSRTSMVDSCDDGPGLSIVRVTCWPSVRSCAGSVVKR
jgi:hypothetical protein